MQINPCGFKENKEGQKRGPWEISYKSQTYLPVNSYCLEIINLNATPIKNSFVPLLIFRTFSQLLLCAYTFLEF